MIHHLVKFIILRDSGYGSHEIRSLQLLLFIQSRIIFLVLFFTFFYFNISNAKTVREIVVVGNDRISDETVVMFSNIEIGNNIQIDLLNDALKEIYSTDYFKDVSIKEEDGVIIINVIENPIIQEVIIKGIEKDNIFKIIEEITLKSEKYPFIESKINDQVNLLKNILKSYGYYFVELKTSININPNNTINLTYNFDLGDVAKIKKINFIGEKKFRDNTLRNIIVSEETKFWKFITKNKYLDSNRVKLDQDRLKNFYKNRGYFDVKVKSTTAIINNDNNFELIFNIKSGDKFFINDIKFENQNSFTEKNIQIFQDKFNVIKGKSYSQKELENLIDELNELILKSDFVFVNASYQEIIKDNNKIDILIKFDELDKQFVKRINIFGNYITDEKVIRNSLIIDEGDPYNKILFDKSMKNLKAKNIFKSVKHEINTDEDFTKMININVEEKPTGEIFAGAGTGTTGTSLTAGIKENNYLGLGIVLDTNFTITDDTLKGKFSVWREHGLTSGVSEGKSSDGMAVLTSGNQGSYLCGWPDQKLLNAIMKNQMQLELIIKII